MYVVHLENNLKTRKNIIEVIQAYIYSVPFKR